MPDNSPHPLRKPLLIIEFSSLAILLASMAWFANQSTAESPVNPAWLLLPAAASLGVFLSFIGLMYLRWVASANGQGSTRQKLAFSLLAMTLLGVWVFSIANTWLSLTAAP
ncbi:hypothetical protein [Marinobacter halophilus]|uniref:Uncharacterized protein n=1 Tax=Marinobacter halophilus TaxID=1323740 RepID=A0A2T1KJW1_9GAMM|nr:hypothetical protein [Marinobacter halophilus]PSF10300.1 hypothetical protein C7H08_02050 [Marinobacter halophilus]GGC69566.1 hypothetical protein GCM10011362_17560 [Marinobacter halophilus]